MSTIFATLLTALADAHKGTLSRSTFYGLTLGWLLTAALVIATAADSPTGDPTVVSLLTFTVSSVAIIAICVSGTAGILRRWATSRSR